MKKLMSIFGVILFASSLTLTSCGDSTEAECAEDCAKECCEANVCAKTGEACLDDHSCCAEEAAEEIDAEEVATESEDATEEVAAEEVATEEESAE